MPACHPARTLSDVTPRQTRLLSQTEPLYDGSRGTKIRGDEILPDIKTCDHAVGRVSDMGLRLARQVGRRARPHVKRVARGRPVCGRGFWMTRLLDLSCINSRSRRLCVSCENHVKIASSSVSLGSFREAGTERRTGGVLVCAGSRKSGADPLGHVGLRTNLHLHDMDATCMTCML